MDGKGLGGLIEFGYEIGVCGLVIILSEEYVGCYFGDVVFVSDFFFLYLS